MRTLILALIPGLLLAACSDDTTASAGTTESTTDSTGATTSGDPTGSPTGDPTTAPSTDPTTGVSDSDGQTTNPSGEPATTPATDPGSTDPVTGDPATTGPATTGDTTSTATGDTTDTTTGDTTDTTDTDTDTDGGLCGADGPEVDATLVHIGEDPGCGPLEYTGTNNELSAGPVYTLDGCPCDAQCIKPDPWTLTITAPADWLPGPLPKCPRVVVERQNSKQGCQLVGVAIWDTDEPDGSPAVYHAGHALGPIAAVAGQLATEQTVAQECECDNCCNTPARYDLTFSALGSDLTLAEGEVGMLGTPQLGYEVSNFQSHLSGLCDDPAAIDWVARRVGEP